MEKVDFTKIKVGECFRLTKNGPIYMRDCEDGGQCILGKSVGKVTDWLAGINKKVYPVKVKITVQ